MIDSTKWRVPVGSLIVDISLVFAVIWWGGTATEKLDNMHTRLLAIENRPITPEAAQRIAVLEMQEREVTRRLSRIEDKLDAALDRGTK